MTHSTNRARVTRYERHAEEVVVRWQEINNRPGPRDIRHLTFMTLREAEGLVFDVRPNGTPDEPISLAPGAVIEAVRFLVDPVYESAVEFTVWGQGKMMVVIVGQLEDVVVYEVETDDF